MTREDDLEEMLELQAEIQNLLEAMTSTKNKEDYKLYREMIRLNIQIIRSLQEKKDR